MKRFLALAAFAILLAGCGSAAALPGSNPSPSPSSGLGYAITATNTDHAVTMRVGQKLEVVLRAGPGMNNWSHPASNDTSVLAPIVDPAAAAVIGVSLAAFEAMKPGDADVTANASPKCSPGQACPMYLAVYSLRVTVRP